MESPLLTLQETANILKVSKKTMYELVKSEGFPSVKIGGWKVIKSKLEPWIEGELKKNPYYE